MGSQMAKTDGILLNVAGHRLDDDPVPILYVGPTRSNVEKVIEPRIKKMVRGAPSLTEKMAEGKSQSKTYKNIAGTSFRLAWAGSATELASEPACIVMVDERDRMDDDVGGEGDPFELAEARNSTYPDGKAIGTSTPTIGNVEAETLETGLTHWQSADAADIGSQIWKLWQEGTRFEWAWPCPHCREYYVPRFNLLQWPKGSTPTQALHRARMCCPHCGALSSDKDKDSQNQRGVYVAPGQTISPEGEISGETPDNDCASYWVSGLCSTWRSYGQLARRFLNAVNSGDPERIQGVINTGFGELYKLKGDAPEWQSVADLREPYPFGYCPDWVRVITCGVDVQKDRLYYVIRGWGVNYESTLIRHGELYGETAHDAVWAELGGFHALRFGEDEKRIDRLIIDSGYRPGDSFKRPDNQVYSFCRRFPSWAVPAKGHDTQDKPLKSNVIDVTVGGRVLKGGMKLWHVDSDHYKSWVHSRLAWPKGESGAWHLPLDATDDYCQQVVAETRIVKPSGRAVWKKIRKDNHYLDCEALAVVGADMLRVWRYLPEQPKQKPRAKPKQPAPSADGWMGNVEGWL